MAKEVKRLNARSAVTISQPGRHADGDGLYLVVDTSGARRWLFLFRWQGKLKEMGLGGLSSVTLAQARGKAEKARQAIASGLNPIEERRRIEAEQAKVVTFGEFVDDLLPTLSTGFRNDKHAAQWVSTLKTYAAKLRPKPIDSITTDDILDVLKPIWTTKPETASRVRGRLERVLGAARAKGLRPGENPALWRGHLDQLLPRRQKLSRGHHAALPFQDVPSFVADLRQREATAARALEFLILTAARTGEVLGAVPAEIDTDARVWTVPAVRMKAEREHRVPLCDRSLAILQELAPLRTKSGYLFPGAQRDQPLSDMAMDMLLRRMGQSVTVHGFRSSFRDWAGEATEFPREIAEAALAHTVGDATERAYRRGDALDRRRKLMQAWAEFVSRENKAACLSGQVQPMGGNDGD